MNTEPPNINDARSADLVEALDNCQLETLTHEDHVRIAWHLLRSTDFATTIARLPQMLKRFATSKEMPNHYHETITVAFIAIIHERLHQQNANDWPTFKSANPDLFNRKVLKRFYNTATLDSDLARQVFVLPTS
ncbi:MAG: hypothetical protein KDA54_16540 [Phycisphaerales bacterium]|nr:hypothetical protein [Phycisphaerales bacterium]